MTNWTIEQADVIKWAEAYRGEPFHFLFCDPPYHLQEMTNRFGKDESAPAQYGKDGAFRRMSKGFMGKKWDGGDISFDPATWAAFLPLMHDGAFGAAYAASRNWHRMAVAIEDAGFFIHDTLFLWVQGQGMPKGSRIDRHYQEQRHGWDGNGMRRNAPAISNQAMLGLSLQERLEIWKEERRWQEHRYGLQTLAPRVEPILIFQKPWSSGVQRDNVIATGAGCMNVDGCRVGLNGEKQPGGSGNKASWRRMEGRTDIPEPQPHVTPPDGRWPSNFGLVHTPDCVWVGEKRVRGNGPRGSSFKSSGGIMNVTDEPRTDNTPEHYYADPDGFETVDDWACSPGCPARRLGEMSGERSSGGYPPAGKMRSWVSTYGEPNERGEPAFGPSNGTAARYFPQFDWRYDIAERLLVADPVRYVPKVGTGEREAGLHALALRTRNRVNPGGLENEPRFAPVERHNDHPTLKPLSLNKWLCTLFLPPEGFHRRVLIPFAGAMSEGVGALLAGWDEIVAVEMGADYCDIGRARMAWWEQSMRWGLTNVEVILKWWSAQKRREAERQAEPEPGPEQLELFGG